MPHMLSEDIWVFADWIMSNKTVLTSSHIVNVLLFLFRTDRENLQGSIVYAHLGDLVMDSLTQLSHLFNWQSVICNATP